MALEIGIWPLQPIVFDGLGVPYWQTDGTPLGFPEFPSLDFAETERAPRQGVGLLLLLLLLAGGLYVARRLL